MSLFDDYLAEIEERKKQDLKPKPIDGGALTAELIGYITDTASPVSYTHLTLPTNYTV